MLNCGVVGAGVVVVLGVFIERDRDVICEIVGVSGGVGVLSLESCFFSIVVDISSGS